jgi:hypothetical protein
VNVVHAPRIASRYYEYAPLFHLLSRSQAQRHWLPLLRTGIWPFLTQTEVLDRYLPADFETRVAWVGRGGMAAPDPGLAIARILRAPT